MEWNCQKNEVVLGFCFVVTLPRNTNVSHMEFGARGLRADRVLLVFFFCVCFFFVCREGCINTSRILMLVVLTAASPVLSQKTCLVLYRSLVFSSYSHLTGFLITLDSSWVKDNLLRTAVYCLPSQFPAWSASFFLFFFPLSLHIVCFLSAKLGIPWKVPKNFLVI